MTLSANLTRRLLGAIEADTLIFLCGAGLSIPSPSYLPSAISVAQECYDQWQPVEVLDPAMRSDIDLLAGHFHAIGEFEKIFIAKLVPWNDLFGAPNSGHAAIADFLISRCARAALSANFDVMIEHWAGEHKIAMQGALDGYEATEFSSAIRPLVKFHGCVQRDRQNTLWTKRQLAEPVIQERVRSCSQWMNMHLPGKDLVVVGFWTDWGYLNDVLGGAFTVSNASSVTVIDPSPTADLQRKAPGLWAELNRLSRVFEHVQASGTDALDELRTAFSKTWARRFYALGQPLVQAAGGTVPVEATPDGLTGEDLYNLRRDAEGVPYNRAATSKAPPPESGQAALAHMMLLNAGARKQGAWLHHGHHSIRVVNGAGKGLSDVQGKYKEPATVPQAEIVICAGAIDFGVPPRLIASGRGASMVRPSPGAGARWLTLDQAKVELGL